MEGDGREKAVGDSHGNGSIALADEWAVVRRVYHAAVDLDELEWQAARGAPPESVS